MLLQQLKWVYRFWISPVVAKGKMLRENIKIRVLGFPKKGAGSVSKIINLCAAWRNMGRENRPRPGWLLSVFPQGLVFHYIITNLSFRTWCIPQRNQGHWICTYETQDTKNQSQTCTQGGSETAVVLHVAWVTSTVESHSFTPALNQHWNHSNWITASTPHPPPTSYTDG